MKRKILKLFKIISTILILVIVIITMAILWPMPKLTQPIKQSIIFIKSINIIDVNTGNVLKNRDILIINNKINAIDTTGIINLNPKALIINGSNQYIIPGLWDMHTHSNQHSEWLDHPLYIANGVTGIRDMSGQLSKRDSYWAGSQERLRWNAELSDNKRTAPRYVLQSSYQMDGAFSVPDDSPAYFKLQKSEDVDSLLRFYQKEKVDFIKVYDQIPAESYKKLALQAPNYGMHIAGHKPIFTSLKDAILLGQRSFEHGRIFLLECFPNADSLRTSDNWKTFLSKSKNSMVKDYNPELATRLMLLMKEHNAHWVPTLQTLKFEAFAHEPIFLQNPNLKYVISVRKRLWWGIDVRNNKKKNLSKAGSGLSTDFYNAAKKQIKMADDIGVPIMTGTDVTDTYIFAGFSLHDELEDLTKSGLSNLKALQCATIIPAKYVGKDKDFGTIEIGKIADLVILNKNPLHDITNSKTINGVIMNGIYYNSDKIDELKAFVESVSSSFHMNVKVFYSLINSPLVRMQWAD